VLPTGTSQGTTVRLSFPPEAQLLGTVRLVVGMVARKAGVDEEGIEDLKVAVSETCAVAVTDLAWAGLDAPIELDVIVEPDRFGIEVRDRAPATQDPPRRTTDENGDLDDRQFGLALVGALVDDLASEPLEGGRGHRTRFWLHRRGDDEPPPLT
jgi:anti-sigma regulatory factor (Ser/Thr protein kinase)